MKIDPNDVGLKCPFCEEPLYLKDWYEVYECYGLRVECPTEGCRMHRDGMSVRPAEAIDALFLDEETGAPAYVLREEVPLDALIECVQIALGYHIVKRVQGLPADHGGTMENALHAMACLRKAFPEGDYGSRVR